MAFTIARRGSIAASAVQRHIIPLTTQVADATTNYSDVQPGDTVYIESGSRGKLQLFNFTGTAENPITFINDGGVVNIAGTYTTNGASGNFAGIELRNCKYIRVSGSNLDGVKVGSQYPEEEQAAGINITNVERGVTALTLDRYLTELPSGGNCELYIEVDHINIGPIAKNGVHAGNDDSLDGSYTVLGLNLHHLYIHDIGTVALGMPLDPSVTGEGLYLGASSTYGTGTTSLMGDVQVNYCYVARTTRDGIQISSCPTGDNLVSYNVVDTTGTLQEGTHSSGIQINRGTSTDIIGNRIYNSGKEGIYDQGLHEPGISTNQLIANNLIVNSGVDFAGSAMDIRRGNQAVDNPDTPGFPHSVWVFNNTIVNTTSFGIRCRVADGTDNQIRNNIIYGVVSSAIEYGDGATATESTNLTADPMFVDALNENYQLQQGSPAIETGYPLAGILDYDLLQAARPQLSGWDIGAYEYNGPFDPDVPGVPFDPDAALAGSDVQFGWVAPSGMGSAITDYHIEYGEAAGADEAVINDSTGAFFDAYDGGGQQVASRVNGLDLLNLGGTTGIDANDPKYLSYSSGEHYAWFPNNADNGMHTPWQSGMHGNNVRLRVAWYFNPADQPGSQAQLFGAINSTAGAYVGLQWRNTGGFRCRVSNGSTIDNIDIGSGVITTEGWYVAQAEFDLSGTPSVNVSYKTASSYSDAKTKMTDAAGWTSVGSASAPTITAINASPSNNARLGSRTSSGDIFNGRIVSADWSVDSSVVISFDPGRDLDTGANADAGQTGWTSVTGETWSITRSAAGYYSAVVTRPVWLLDGSDDVFSNYSFTTPYIFQRTPSSRALHYVQTDPTGILSAREVYLVRDWHEVKQPEVLAMALQAVKDNDYHSPGVISWSAFNDGVSTNTSVTVTGLASSTSYVFRVRAENGIGLGPWSVPSNSVTIP